MLKIFSRKKPVTSITKNPLKISVKFFAVVMMLGLATFSAVVKPKSALAAACPFVDGAAPDTDGNSSNNVILITGNYTITADASNQGNFDCSMYNVTVNSGGVLTMASYSNPSDGTFYGVNLTVNNLSVGGGVITANGQGWAGGAANQDGNGPGKGLGGSGANSGNGGGYGGRGNLYADGGANYGDPYAPIDLGSGGGGADGVAGAAGGGAIHIMANQSITLSSTGSIEAKGLAANDSSTSVCGGAGSGGSIWMRAGVNFTITTGFVMTADGGSASQYHGCNGTGGGGRIYLDGAYWSDHQYLTAKPGFSTHSTPSYGTTQGSGQGTVLPDYVSIRQDGQYASDGVTPIAVGGTAPANYLNLTSSLSYLDPQSLGIQASGAVVHNLSNTNQTSVNLSDSISGYQNVLIAVHAAYEGSETISGITYNDQGSRSQNFTKGCSSTVNGIHNDIWYLVAPNYLSSTISVNFTGAGASKVGIQATNFANVDQSTPVASSVCNQSSSSSTTPTVTVNPTGMQVAFGGVAINTPTTLTPDAASYNRDNLLGSDFSQYTSIKLAGSSMSWTSPTSADWATSAIILNSSVIVANPSNFSFYWQYEVKPIGTSFTNSSGSYVPITFNGSIGEFANQITLPSTGSYHLQSRVCDQNYRCYSWFPFGNNAESQADFVINYVDTPPNFPASLGSVEVINGIPINNPQPVFNMTLSDPNGGDTVGYEIQIASDSTKTSGSGDASYVTPIVDYISPVGSQGTQSFTVGQAAGSGTYLVGSALQYLPLATYYWQVRTIDQFGAKSNFNRPIRYPPFQVSNIAPVVDSLGPTALVDGSNTFLQQPNFTFNTTPYSGQVQYEIQVASDSAFTTPAVDYTSALGAQGNQSFTVGQMAGSGSYKTGNADQTLAVGSYYWRVLAIDQYGVRSSYTTANSGSVAFNVVYQPPHACPFVDGQAPDADGNASNNIILIHSNYTVTANPTNQGVFDCSAYDIRVGYSAQLNLVSYSNSSNGTFYGVDMKVNNLTVEGGGKILADGQGWAGGAAGQDGKGPGKGLGGTGSTMGGGGGYGSAGGDKSQGGISYGDKYNPIDLGSGGGGAAGLTGGAGGGAIKFTATGTIIVSNGTISANGLAGNYTGTSPNALCSGSGAGGSIWLIGSTISYSGGTISANGGDAYNGCSSGGGGGRIRFSQANGNTTPAGFMSVRAGYQDGYQQNGSVWPLDFSADPNSTYNGDGITKIPTGGTSANSTVLLKSSTYYNPTDTSIPNASNGNYSTDDYVTPTTLETLNASLIGADHNLLAVYIGYQGTETISGVTLDNTLIASQNLIQACASTTNDLHNEMWYIASPILAGGGAASNFTLSAAFTGAGVSHVSVETANFPGVDPTHPIASAHCNQSSSSSTNLSVAAPIGQSQVAFGGASIDNTGSLANDATSQNWDFSTGAVLSDSVDVKSQGTSFNWTAATAGNWTTAAIVMNSFSPLVSTEYHYRAEIEPTGTSFTNTPTFTTPFFFNGINSELAIPYNSPATGSYHWQSQVCDSNDANCSNWSMPGGNPNFVVSTLNTSPNDPINLGPTDLTIGATSSNAQPTFSFDLSDPDGSDQVGYEIQIASDSAFLSPAVDYVSAVGAQGAASFTVGQAVGAGYYNLGSSGQTLAIGSYYWRVKAIDQNTAPSFEVVANGGDVAFRIGNGSGVDTTPPVLHFTTSANANVRADQVQYVGVAVDETAMTSVEYSVDGGSRVNANPDTSNPLSYAFSIDLTSLNLSLGAHTVEFFADDTSANEVNHTFTLNVVTDSTPPTMSFTASASGDVLQNDIHYVGTATDNVAMADVLYGVDGGTPVSEVPDTSNPLSYPIYLDFSGFGLSYGAHTIEVYAVDATGNQSVQVFHINVVIDTTLPAITYTSLPSGDVYSSQVVVAGHLTDNVGLKILYFNVDGSPGFDAGTNVYDKTNPKDWLFSLDFSSWNLAPGPHNIGLSIHDTSDNYQQASIDFNVIPDTTPPVFTYTASPSAEVVSSNIKVTGHATDNVGMSAIDFNIDNTGTWDTGASGANGWAFALDFGPYYLAPGPHTLTLYAHDTSGNVNTQVLNFTVITDSTAPVMNFTTSTSGPVLSTGVQYVGTATDNFQMSTVQYSVDGGSRIDAHPDTSNSTSFPFAIDLTSLNLSGGAHTIDIFADDTSANETTQAFSIYVTTDFTPPDLSFTASPGAYTRNPVTFTGTAADSVAMGSVKYAVDGGSKVDAAPDTTDPLSYPFTFNVSLADGSHTVVVYADDAAGNETTHSFTFDDSSSVGPSCTAGWMNQPSPVYTAMLNYTNVHCTGPVPIVSAAYNVYHNGLGGIVGATPVNSVSGVTGTDETYNFTVDLSGFGNIDGTMEVGFGVTDAAGNSSYDYDPVTLAATDNTAPTINLDAITPNPLTDTQPTITGSCRDDTPLAKNTYISNMNYSVDGGANTDLVPLDGTYNDAFTKNFSVKLFTLALGAHTVTLHCTDGNNNTSTAPQSFSVVAPSSASPGTFNYTENFTTTLNQDIPNTNNMIWGNGKLRLKEDITVSRTLINSTGHCPIYADCRNTGGVWQDPVDPHKIYYFLGGVFYIYNTQTQTNTVWDYASIYGIGNYGPPTVFYLGVFQGKEYMWIANIYNMTIVNMTDHTHVFKDIHNVNGFAPDLARGRLAAYLQGDAASGYSNLSYLDLNGTLTDETDDTYTRIPLSTLDTSSFLGPMMDAPHNYLYWSAYGNGLYKWDDHNNPADVTHYTVTHINDYRFSNVWSMTLDPQSNLIYGTGNNGNQGIYVVQDNGHPLDFSQQTVTQIATNRQLGYLDVGSLSYITGQNGVGDQLLINNGSDPTYFNFNSNYTTMSDKTFIKLPIIQGLRPDSAGLLLTDYNTGYAVVKNQGFFKVDLHRGWATSGDAVALPTRPPQALVVDNFVANASTATPIASLMKANVPQNFLASLSKAFVPQAQAAGGNGITYFVSTDGGVTWTEVSLGQLQQMQQADYRVKFKISMVPVNGASPVLDSYSLAYAGYQNQAQQTTTVGLGVTSSLTSVAPGTNFSLTVQGVDTLGYLTPSYTGAVTLSLIDANSNAVVSGLNVSGATIGAGGTTTLSNVQISKTGTFKIRTSDGTFSNDSAVITVATPSAPPTNTPNLNSPSVAFWADSYTIKAGETVNLNWSSANVTSWKIQPNDKVLDKAAGSYTVAPTQTTTYTITVDGPNGSLTNSLTIVVAGQVSSTTSPSTSSSSAGLATNNGAATKSSGTSSDFVLTTSADTTIVKGEKTSVSWNILGADTVSVDYPTPHQVSSNGSFEFYPTTSTVITFTATKAGVVTTKSVAITVIDAPVQVQQAARWFQKLFPALTPIVSGAIQSTKSLPKIGLGVAAAIELGVVGLLTASIAAQVGLTAAFDGKTFLNILSAAGIIPVKQRKGFVHQTKTGEPIPFALISVYESAKVHLHPIVTLVTDMFGVYTDPFLSEGEYDFVVAQDEFSFPTKLQRPIHLSYKDFYRGEVLNVASKKDRSSLLIPMDAKAALAKSKVWRARLLLSLNRTLNASQILVIPFALMAVVAFWLSPGVWNLLIISTYVVILVPKVMRRFRTPVLQGRVTNAASRQPVLNATVTLSTLSGSVVALSKTDAQGRFAFFAPSAEYSINVVSSNLLWNEATVGTLYTVKAAGRKTAPLNFTMSKIENPFGPTL